MKNHTLFNDEFISTREAVKLAPYTLQAVRYWCKKNRKYGLAFKHSNKWYLKKQAFLAFVND